MGIAILSFTNCENVSLCQQVNIGETLNLPLRKWHKSYLVDVTTEGIFMSFARYETTLIVSYHLKVAIILIQEFW